MSAEEVGGVVRTVLAALGGYLVAKGVVDAATVTAVAGAIGTLVVAVWSVWVKRKAAP